MLMAIFLALVFCHSLVSGRLERSSPDPAVRGFWHAGKHPPHRPIQSLIH